MARPLLESISLNQTKTEGGGMSDVAEQFRLLDGMSTEEFHKLIEAEKMGGSATEQTGALFNCLTQGAPMNAIKGALSPEPVQPAESWASTYCTPGPSGFYPPPASASNYPTPTSAYVQNSNPAAPYYYQYPPEWGQNPNGSLTPYQAPAQSQGQVPPSPAAPPPQSSTSSLAPPQPAGPPPLTALLQLLVMRICKDRPTTQIIETIIPLLMEHQKDLTYTEPPSGINIMLMSAIERLANAPPPPPEPARPAPPPRRSRVREGDSDDSLSASELSIFSSDSSTSESSSTSLETRRRRKHRNRSSKKKRHRTPSPPPRKKQKKKKEKQSEARDDRKKKSRRKEKGRCERSTSSSRSSSSRRRSSSSSSSESQSSSSVSASQHSTPRKPEKASKQPAETPPMTASPPPEPKTIQTPPKAKSRFSLFKKDPDAAARKKEQKEQKAAEKAALKAQKQADKAARKATKSVRVSSPVKVDPPSLSEAGSDGSDESEAPSEPSPPPKKATAPDPDPVDDEGSGDSDDDDDTDAKCRAATRRAKALQEAAEEAKEQAEQESKKKKGRFSLLGGKGAAKPKEVSEEGTWFASAGTRAHFAWAVYVISTRLSETTERDSEKQFPHRFVKEKVYETSPIQWQGRCSVLSPIFVKAAYPTDGTDTAALISSLADCLKFWPNEELMGPKVWKYVGKTGAKGSLDGLIETLPEGKPGTWAAHGWRHLVFCMNSAAKSHATSSPYLAQFFALSLCPPSWKPKDVKKNSVKIAAFLTAIAGSGADVERPDRCPQP